MRITRKGKRSRKSPVRSAKAAKRAHKPASSGARPDGARDLFQAWPEISKRLRRNRHWAIFLDYDGTLVPTQPTPGRVPLPERGRRVLRSLARRRRVRVNVISGRSVRSVRHQVGVPGIGYIGQHGMEPSTKATAIPPTVHHAVLLAKRALWARLRGLPGVWVEDKGACFAVHYRGARAPVARRAGRAVRQSLGVRPEALRILAGKKVWEVLPRRAGKSVAVKESLKKFPARPLVIFAGDDRTDEEVFEVLRGSITIRVGSGRRTRAKYFLRSPQDMLTFLERLESLR
jgi:trehalose-phosphatase